MHATKVSFLFVFCFITIISVRAQTAINLYPINSTVGVKFRTEKKISFEPRVNFQTDFVNGESNIFVSSELFTTVNFLKDEHMQFYSGVGLGGNIYNQAQSNFTGTIPFGVTYFINDKRRIAIVGECGIKTTVGNSVKIKSYALVGLQIRLRKN